MVVRQSNVLTLNLLQSLGLKLVQAGTKKYGLKPWMWVATLCPSIVNPNMRIMGTTPTEAPGIPGSGVPGRVKGCFTLTGKHVSLVRKIDSNIYI